MRMIDVGRCPPTCLRGLNFPAPDYREACRNPCRNQWIPIGALKDPQTSLHCSLAAVYKHLEQESSARGAVDILKGNSPCRSSSHILWLECASSHCSKNLRSGAFAPEL